MERHLVSRTTPALVTPEHVGRWSCSPAWCTVLTCAHRYTCHPPLSDCPSAACPLRSRCLKQRTLPGSCRAERCDTPPRSSAWGCDTPLSAWWFLNWAGPACIQRGRTVRGSLDWLRYPNSIFKRAGWESLLSFPERRNQRGIYLLPERLELACLWED